VYGKWNAYYNSIHCNLNYSGAKIQLRNYSYENAYISSYACVLHVGDPHLWFNVSSWWDELGLFLCQEGMWVFLSRLSADSSWNHAVFNIQLSDSA